MNTKNDDRRGAVAGPVERPVRPLLPPADLLVECAQGFVHGWTEGLVLDYAARAVAAERERPRQVVAYMATSRKGTVRFTDNPDAARELEGYGWAITPLAEAGPNAALTGSQRDD